MEQKVSIFQLLKGSMECIDQMVGQFGNEANGIGKDHVQIVGNCQLTGGGIQRIKQAIIGRDSRIGQLVQKRGLACVGIAHNGNHGNGIFLAALTLNGTHLAHLFQFRFQTVDPLTDMTAVGFQLGLTGATGADTAALTGKAQTHAGKSGEQIFILGKFNLQSALFGLGTLGKNVENQGAAVKNCDTNDVFQRADISRGKFVIKNNHGRSGGFHQHFHFQRLTLADEAVAVGGMAILQNLACAEAAGSFQKRFQFFNGLVRSSLFFCKAVRVQSYQNRPLLHMIFKVLFHSSSNAENEWDFLRLQIEIYAYFCYYTTKQDHGQLHP